MRRVTEGTSACLVQSGLADRWWHKAMQCFCFPRNVVDLRDDGVTAFEKRYGEPCNRPIGAFGQGLRYQKIPIVSDIDSKGTNV